MLVYVLNKNGEPLMPCSPRKARILLKEGMAFIKKKEPFTIQLKYGSSGYKQDINLGVDAGSEHIGLSATTEKKVLFESDVLLRNDVTKLLEERRAFRQARRSRKTRYRKARFLNRVKSKHKGWLAPSIEQKINCHINQIQKVYSILPIKKLIVETAQFDIQKLQKLKDDLPYFSRNCLKIKTKNEGIINFNFTNIQADAHRRIEERKKFIKAK